VKLPHAEDVHIDEAKVRGYLLSASHPIGRSKARVFAALGFNPGSPAAFIAELRRLAATEEVSEHVETSFGRKYTVHGHLQGPVGSRSVATVWLLEHGQKRVRLVTVRPR
jgi:uncharacterized protein DUF6883